MTATLALSGISFASLAIAGFIAPTTFASLITHKRNGALHFARIGRLSVSWCIRKAH